MAMIPLLCAPGFTSQAVALSQQQGLVFDGERLDLKSEKSPLVLWLDDQGLSLRQTGKKAVGPVRADFAAGAARHRRLYGGGKSQAIARAVGIKGKVRPTIADLTAGLGSDSFVLATLGCRVTLIERHPVIWTLLDDAIARAERAAGCDPELAASISRMSLTRAGALDWMVSQDAGQQPDVIYLDPMFPERVKSAQVNKAMQVFQQLVGDDLDADGLLPVALQTAQYRVVVKRPTRAPWLNNQAPGYSLEGKSTRYDIYPLKKMADK
jgi:16S rRNA (guanine1516-N2)-methyltransferase